MRLAPLAAFAAIVFASATSPTHAADSYDSCVGTIASLPAVITVQGTWCMKSDLSTPLSSGDAIVVSTNNVTIDCNGYKLGGLAAGDGTATTGIKIVDRLNATVRRCSIRGFNIGVGAYGGGGHVVEDSRFEANRHSAVSVHETVGSTIRRNLIVDTGGSTSTPNESYAIYSSGSADILDNTIDGVHAVGPNANTHGIVLFESANTTVSGNRIKGVDRVGAGLPRGITLFLTSNAIVSGNMLQTSPVIGGTAIDCIDLDALAVGNRATGFGTFVDGCTDNGNVSN